MVTYFNNQTLKTEDVHQNMDGQKKTRSLNNLSIIMLIQKKEEQCSSPIHIISPRKNMRTLTQYNIDKVT